MNTQSPAFTRSLGREQAIRRQTEILRDANVALTENLSLDKVIATLLDFLTKLVPYDSANVMLRVGDSQFVVNAFRRSGGFQDVETTRFIAFDARTNHLLRRICLTKQTVIVADTHRETGWQWVNGGGHVRNLIGVALIASGKGIGVYLGG